MAEKKGPVLAYYLNLFYYLVAFFAFSQAFMLILVLHRYCILFSIVVGR